MEKRSAARELAFLAIFQLPQKTENIKLEKLAKTDLHALCLSSLRTLADYTRDNLKVAESFFIKVERYLMEYQINHPDNEGLDEAVRGVPLPQSDEFIEHLNNCYTAIGLMRESLQLPEVYWHYHDESVQEFVVNLLLQYANNRDEIKATIAEASDSWDITRMHKIDRILIELAVTEMSYFDLPHAVVISEIIKIANKYSTPQGVKFINGVLADISKSLSVTN